MTALLALAFLAMVFNALRVRGSVLRHEQMQVIRSGLIRIELWRSARLVAHYDASGRRTFPLPQETRTRLWRCAGVPFRREVQSLGLPNQVTDQIGRVDSAEFDALFSPEFRRAAGVNSPAARVSSAQSVRLSRL